MNVSAQSLLIQERDSRSSSDKRAPVKFGGAPFNVHEFLLRKSNSRKILRALSLQNNQNNDQFDGNPIFETSLHWLQHFMARLFKNSKRSELRMGLFDLTKKNAK
jgi:hypothetical protein